MSMVEIRYYNVIWYVPENESQIDMVGKIIRVLPKVFPRIRPNNFVFTDIQQDSSTTITVKGVVGTKDIAASKNVVLHFYFEKESNVPSWMVCDYKIRNIPDLTAILRRITYRVPDEIRKPPEEIRTGMSSENGAYINMRMMDEGDLMVNREPMETSTNFIITLTTNQTKIFNGEKEVLKSMIKSVTINEKKKVTTVVFTDGDVQMAKCSKNDEYDKTVGISICIAAHLAGSKEKLKKFVKEITEK